MKFGIGQKVDLVDDRAMKHARKGATAVVVDSDEFKSLKRKLVDSVGEYADEFVAIRWLDEPTCQQMNGFYAKYRFKQTGDYVN